MARANLEIATARATVRRSPTGDGPRFASIRRPDIFVRRSELIWFVVAEVVFDGLIGDGFWPLSVLGAIVVGGGERHEATGAQESK